MGPETKPVYKIPDHLLTGVEGQEFHVNNRRDKEEMARVVKEASLEVLRRTREGRREPVQQHSSIIEIQTVVALRGR